MLGKPYSSLSRVNRFLQKGIAASYSIFDFLIYRRGDKGQTPATAFERNIFEWRSMSFKYPGAINWAEKYHFWVAYQRGKT